MKINMIGCYRFGYGFNATLNQVVTRAWKLETSKIMIIAKFDEN